MIEDSVYMRIGTSLYKRVDQPTLDGCFVKKLVPWTYSAMKQDECGETIASIEKYDGFCSCPKHINYERKVGKFYNLYEPLSHVLIDGEFPHIQILINHIFGEHAEFGYDYLQLLYLEPAQKLPILLLVSKERNTGKTTFLNFLKCVFQDNVTFNTNEDFRSQFNADWAGKLLVLVDEVLLCRREDSERLKNLSTTLTYKIEAKGKDRQEVNFFAKFVLCSNNERLPVLIDKGETRYWVRKIQPLQIDDTEFLVKLQKEIPAFLYHLTHRNLSTVCASRMWFAPESIHTEALDLIIQSNQSHDEFDIAEVLLDVMDTLGIDSFSFCINDLMPLLEYNNVKLAKSAVRRVLRDNWQIPKAGNSLSYETCKLDPLCKYTKKSSVVGRFFTVARCFVTSILR